MEKNTLEFNEDFIKNYDEDSDKGYIIEVDSDYPNELLILHSDFRFSATRKKLINAAACLYSPWQRELYCSHKNVKAGIKSRTNIKESAHSNPL